ncbi:unnamed protein product [Adineta steineri]|uniref:Calpain catalytic domain-containing protein n=1 Tax=Adineta steineri TaxID=433720 RepID=A0A818XVG1_9BILA|nr:unnamed protein product [Adineta steineri]CAF3741815.1 unnamed protein product [Adineta steineri]
MSINVWPTGREPYHGDILQGRLGNCFLIASLQALASCQPSLLKSIISSSSFICFFYRQGERIEVPIILQSLTDEYQYCRSTVMNVQWPYIIEQAYAQFYGGRYENLIGGNTSEALYDLLGKPVEEVEPNDTDLWNRIEKGLTNKNILVTCGAIRTNESTTTATTTTTNNGLIVNHAYAILATFIYQRTREKYVVIHNPHGINHICDEDSRAREAFFASISKSHPLWSNTPGTQLVTWSELKQSCNRIQICHLDVQPYQNLFGNWAALTNGGCTNYATFYRNPFVLLPLPYLKKTILIFGHTVDQRNERATTDIKLNYPQIGITVVQLKSHPIPTQDNYEVVCQSKFWNKREVILTINIEPKQGQQYAAILSTYYPNINTSFWLQFFSQQTLPKVELRTWTSAFQQPVQIVHGEWHKENAGGRQIKSDTMTFYQNPAYLLTLSGTSVVRIILHQSFETDVPLAQHHPIGIYILSNTYNDEATFGRARSVSKLARLHAGIEYYIVPTCFEAGSFAKFTIDVLCDVAFTFDATERKLPTSLLQDKKMSNTAVTTRKPITTRTTGTKETPKKGGLSLAAARMSTIADDYSKMT